MVAQESFKRYEKKYLLKEEQYNKLIEKLKEYMLEDEYGKHTICNIYYDTKQYSFIRASIEKPIYKEKFRMRSYGVPKEDDIVFLELKKKYKGVVYKRRAPMNLCQADQYCIHGEGDLKQTQILQEIDWFLKINAPVPKVFIGYDRIALYGKEDPNVRITFDQNMRYRDYDLELSKGDYGEPIIKEGLYLMEIKIPGAMPLWLSHVLTDLTIYSSSFSKYGTCYCNFLLPKQSY